MNRTIISTLVAISLAANSVSAFAGNNDNWLAPRGSADHGYTMTDAEIAEIDAGWGYLTKPQPEPQQQAYNGPSASDVLGFIFGVAAIAGGAYLGAKSAQQEQRQTVRSSYRMPSYDCIQIGNGFDCTPY